MMPTRIEERGAALVTVMLLIVLLMTLLTAYYTLTFMENATTRATMNGARGFYAAEAGVNVRAEAIRADFLGFNRPVGASPVSDGSECRGANQGSGDFACISYQMALRSAETFVVESPDNPRSFTIPRGEAYQNLAAQGYAYDIRSTAVNGADEAEARLEMRLESRLVPLFQFAAFYNKDLEILPGPPMMLRGPVHTNGDLYMDAGDSLDIEGQVTTVGDLYLGRKNADSCTTGNVAVIDPGTLTDLPGCGAGRTRIDQSQLAPWNGMVQTGVEPLTVPPPDALDPDPGKVYWDKADIRLMLDLSGSPAIKVRQADGNVDATRSAALAGCGAATHSHALYNYREGATIDMLDVDVQGLLDCAQINGLLDGGRMLDDSTEGGLVVYLGVDGPDSNAVNSYGVRVTDGADLASTVGGAPAIRGLTVVTNQALYIQGNYNSVDKRPAAFLADSLNVLSNAWSDANSGGSLPSRIASSTTINAAFLAGTDTTGDVEGAGGQDLSQYNGGLENYPRFHEDWSGKTLKYRGSFVSLNRPRHVDGAWSSQSYSPPNRDWDFDVDYRDASNLPPISPRFVYLRQELFVREFD